MQEYEFGRELALEAGRVLATFQNQRREPIWKGPTDFKTKADDAIAQLVRERIDTRFPEHAIWSEELPPKDGDTEKWFVDEIDGTLPFARGFSNRWSFSLGFRGRRLQFGFVNLVACGKFYEAVEGGRALCNLEETHVSECSSINHALVGWDAGKRRDRADILPYVAQLFAPTGVTYAPAGACASAALMAVACGELDAFFAISLEPEDMVGSVPIVRGAGGRVTAFDGGEWHPYCKSILAANPVLHENILKFLKAGL